MRLLLIFVLFFATIAIVAKLSAPRPGYKPQALTISNDVRTPIVNLKPPKIDSPLVISRPEPVVILTAADLNRISDPTLRAFVKRKVDFKREKVLYFEWQGNAEEKMTSISDDKCCTITLHTSQLAVLGQDVVHHQAFIIPLNHSYSCEVGK